jgi:hypothetical protein
VAIMLVRASQGRPPEGDRPGAARTEPTRPSQGPLAEADAEEPPMGDWEEY